MTAQATLRRRRDEARPPSGRHLFRRDELWGVLLAVRRAADKPAPQRHLSFTHTDRGFRQAADGEADLRIDVSEATVVIGREHCEPMGLELLDLFLDLALVRPDRSHVVCMLGQSLDGFIATRSGESRCVNGPASLAHQHRLRALSDAVLIGAATAITDRPRLTTRHVVGPSPVRVVIDPRRRVPEDHGLLTDGLAPTLILHGAEDDAGECRLTDQATAIGVPVRGGELCPRRIIEVLGARGLTRVMVEGGGVTVTRFLAAGAVDRLQLAVAPLLLGDGRPALSLPGVDRLSDAPRPECRNYRFGDDVLFDLRFRRAI